MSRNRGWEQKGFSFPFLTLVAAFLMLLTPLLLHMISRQRVTANNVRRYQGLQAARLTGQSQALNEFNILAIDPQEDHYGESDFSASPTNRSLGTGMTEINELITLPESNAVYINFDAYHGETDPWAISGSFASRFTGNTPYENRHLHQVIHYRSDAARFGHVVSQALTCFPGDPYDNMVITSGLYVKGQLDVSAIRFTMQGGPIIVDGPFVGGLNTTLTAGTTIYAASFSGAGSYAGQREIFHPNIQIPAIDLNWYSYHASTMIASNATLQFKVIAPWTQQPSDPTDWAQYVPPYHTTFVVIDGTDFPLLPKISYNAITSTRRYDYRYTTIVSTNANLTIDATVLHATQGRIAIVALGDPGDPNAGNITIKGDVSYDDGLFSTPQNVLLIIAANRITFESPTDQTVSGFFISNNNDVQVAGGVAGKTFLKINGSLHGKLTSTDGSAVSITGDPGLRKYWPKGLPEIGRVVSLIMQGGQN